MINIEKYKDILNEGLILDHCKLLIDIRSGNKIEENKRIKGFINLLSKKGYIENGKLKDKAIKLLEDINSSLELNNIDKSNLDSWILLIHEKCREKIKSATGKPQVRAIIRGKGYSFLPNSSDLGKVIKRAIKEYKIKDLNAIENTN